MEINTDSLLKISNDLNDSISYLESDYKKINEIIYNMKQLWEGDRADNFLNNLDEIYLSEMSSLIEDMRKYQFFISKVPSSYELLDNIYSEKNIEI